jgi:quercetin dioxygenase-like cupin family protein
MTSRCRQLTTFCLGLVLGAVGLHPLLSTAGAETRTADGVILFDAKEVAAAFATGKMLTERKEYKVMAGHREKAGIPEVHDADTDVFYVLAGEADFTTGGKVIEPRTESPGETRGLRIEGGRRDRLKKGDVVLIPRGVPHWFSEVPKLVDYLVVKITAPEAKETKSAR